ncbi:MAG: hypothetical protein CMM58_01830 [Rhodospirillaceae bacterium]|nr:hypothetical protein [Rhodospirillaceae bacterium]
MIGQFRKPPRIRGVIIPGRRFTLAALIYFVGFIALPLLAVALILDLLGWVIVTKVLEASCYGVMCLF